MRKMIYKIITVCLVFGGMVISYMLGIYNGVTSYHQANLRAIQDDINKAKEKIRNLKRDKEEGGGV